MEENVKKKEREREKEANRDGMRLATKCSRRRAALCAWGERKIGKESLFQGEKERFQQQQQLWEKKLNWKRIVFTMENSARQTDRSCSGR